MISATTAYSSIVDYDSIVKEDCSIKYELYKQIEHDAINEVKFEGFPDRYMSHDIELFNYRYFMCCIDEYMGRPTVCRMTTTANLKNIYGMPTKCMVTYPNMKTARKPIYSTIEPDGVIPFYDTMIPGDGRITRVWPWIERFYDLQLTFDTQTSTHRTPLIMTGTSKEDVEDQANMVADIGAGVKVLTMPQNVVSELKVLDLKAPWDHPDIIQSQAEIMRRIYGCLGLDSPSWPKKERLIVDEQEANDETLSRVLQDMMESRRLSCEMANEKYGWGVSVKIAESPRIQGGNPRYGGYENVDEKTY